MKITVMKNFSMWLKYVMCVRKLLSLQSEVAAEAGYEWQGKETWLPVDTDWFRKLINVWIECLSNTHDKQCSNSWYRVKMCRWISVKHDGWSYGDLEPDLCTQAFCAICAPAINIWFTWKHVITQSARGNVWQGRSVSKRFSESICRTSQIRMSIS